VIFSIEKKSKISYLFSDNSITQGGRVVLGGFAKRDRIFWDHDQKIEK